MNLSDTIRPIGWIRRWSYLGQGFLNSYSQVFFSDKPVTAVLILIVTLTVPVSGLAGIAGVAVSLLLAAWLGFDKTLISKGVFGYNTLLVVLPLGLFFQPGWALVLIVALASLMTFFLTVFFRQRFANHNLPFLSWPFLVALWIIMLAMRKFTSIDVGDQSLFEWNRLYRIGGLSLVNGMEWLENLPIPRAVRTYLISLGAVFFQYSLPAGILVAAGLLISSRIAFLLSLTGFFSAHLFYILIGLDINSLNYTYIGFNYILTAIAVGGFFLIPSPFTFLWTVILMPVVTVLAVSLEELLGGAGLAIYALPFNLAVPLFLYVLNQRKSRIRGLQPVAVQHNSPERNLYAWMNYHNRLSRRTWVLFRLPFLGSWKVSQGHDGMLTHRSDWRYAWDFVRIGGDGQTWSGSGANLKDYYCYGLPVFPAADGYVESVTEGIPDNPPGDANTRDNWGNTVVIRHLPGLYSKYSHLKPGSVRVKPGDYVVGGTEIALTGSSGRSPEPHLHFQIQAEPNTDAATIDYPLGYYLLETEQGRALRSYDRPAEGELVSNLSADGLMQSVFHLIPGQKIRISQEGTGSTDEDRVWEVHTDMYNNSFIQDPGSNAIAWFVNDGQLFYFTHYEGNRRNPLFTFFLACFRIPLSFDTRISVNDTLPLYSTTRGWIRWLQDWIAPFRIVIDNRFFLKFTEADDALSPERYTLETGTSGRIFGKETAVRVFRVEVDRSAYIRIKGTSGMLLELDMKNRK